MTTTWRLRDIYLPVTIETLQISIRNLVWI